MDMDDKNTILKQNSAKAKIFSILLSGISKFNVFHDLPHMDVK